VTEIDPTERQSAPSPAVDRRVALVWIDSEGACILRWRGRVVVERIAADIPQHVHSTAHVRHDPGVRHGGSGRGQDDAERRRNERLRAFLANVAGRLTGEDEIDIIGSGTLCDRLANRIRRAAHGRPAIPTVEVQHVDRITKGQLAARLRERLDMPRRRVTAGAYRWSGNLPTSRSGHVRGPLRVVEKPIESRASDGG
jgi:hypothetical protein